MTTRRQVLLAIAGSLVLLLSISTWYAWHVGYAPDEGPHLTLVSHHADNLTPIDSDQLAYGSQRGHPYNLYSPAPYIAYIPLEWLNDQLGPVEGAARPDWFVTRLGGLLVAAAQFLVTIALVRRLWRHCTDLQAVAVALAVNLLPQLRYLHAYVNTDAVTILVATAAFAVTLRVLQRDRIGLADAALVGLTLGALAHTRYHAWVVGGILLGALAVQLVRTEPSLRTRLRLLGVAVALPVLLAGSFHLAVYDELQNGHILASADNEELRESTFYGAIPDQPPLGEQLSTKVRGRTLFVWRSAWLWYARLVDLRGPMLLLLAGFSLAGAAGIVLPPGRALTPSGRVVSLLALGAVAFLWAGMYLRWPFVPQGRFLLPAGVTALAGIVLGTAALASRITRLRHPVLVASGLWCALLLGLNLWAAARLA